MPGVTDMLRTVHVRHSLGEEISQADWSAEILNQLQLCRALLDRLVALEEERREGERRFESLAEALQPSNEEPEQPLDWYRDNDGAYLERGTGRKLTFDEIATVTYSPRREAARRSR